METSKWDEEKDGNELRLSTVHSFVCSRRENTQEWGGRSGGHAENRNWIKLNFISNFSFSPFIRIYIIFLLFALLCIGLLYIHFDVNSQFATLTQQRSKSSRAATAIATTEAKERKKHTRVWNSKRKQNKERTPPTQFVRFALHIIFHLLCFLTAMWCGEQANNVVSVIIAVVVVCVVFSRGVLIYASIRALISIKPKHLPLEVLVDAQSLSSFVLFASCVAAAIRRLRHARSFVRCFRSTFGVNRQNSIALSVVHSSLFFFLHLLFIPILRDKRKILVAFSRREENEKKTAFWRS